MQPANISVEIAIAPQEPCGAVDSYDRLVEIDEP